MVEVVIFPLVTSLTAAITTTTRPVTFSVASTAAALGGGVFSCLIYDAGTDANPAHAEALQITSGGGGTSWTGTTESGSNVFTHANGSTVVATILTPRSIAQPLTDHITPGTTPDPHNIYILKSAFLGQGYLLVGTGSGAFTAIPAGLNGSVLTANSGVSGGISWTLGSISGNQARLAATASMSVRAANFPSGTNTSTPFNIFSGPNGANLIVNTLTESTTIAAAATTTTTIQIPAGAIVLAVSVRVTTTIPTATTFTVTGNTTGTFNTAAVSTASGSTDPGTAAGAFYSATTQSIKYTPNSTPGSATGVVRSVVTYLTSIPPAN